MSATGRAPAWPARTGSPAARNAFFEGLVCYTKGVGAAFSRSTSKQMYNFTTKFDSGDLDTDGAILPGKRKRLPGIAPEAYRHPLDQQATDSMRSVPGLEKAVSKLSRFGLEQMFYVDMLASAVKVTPRQCGRIYSLLEEACRVLGVTVPALFLTQTPVVNAFCARTGNAINRAPYRACRAFDGRGAPRGSRARAGAYPLRPHDLPYSAASPSPDREARR